MVRGRRTRAATTEKILTTNSTQRKLNGIVNEPITQLFDDEQNYSSPKRKESKIENHTKSHKAKIITNPIVKDKDYTKTRSSQRTIQKYFEPIKLENYISSTISNDNFIDLNDDAKSCLNYPGARNQLNHHKQTYSKYSFELTEDDNETCDVDYSLVQNKKIIPSNLQNTNGSNVHNLFLQEPVLSLNIDKSPNQPSSIVINKTLEADPIFSVTSEIDCVESVGCNYQVNLNGQFNKIVSLNGSPKRNGSSDIESGVGSSSSSSLLSINKYFSLNIDSNSCDSGVNSDDKINISPTKRRKPTTPHRILCPSPAKHPLVEKCTINNDLIMGEDNGNAIKRVTTLTKAAMKNYSSDDFKKVSQKNNPKSRRRLNSTQSENNSSMTTSKASSPQIIGGVRLTTETLKKIIKNKDNLTQKKILNSAKNPTAEQNTNNNLQIQNRIVNHSHQAQQSGQILSDETIVKLEDNIIHCTNAIDDSNSSIVIKKEKSEPTIDYKPKVHLQNGTPSVKDFLPVRRSVRKTKTAVNEEMLKSLEMAILAERDDGLKVKEFEGKGRGVIAKRHFLRSEFVVEYVGDLINMIEANQREKKYSLDENAGCYMYYFKHKNQQYCIDATTESGKLGRLINHSRNGNLMTKVVVIKSRPHLVLIAKDDIQPGEELTYDYGDRSKEALLHHPWLAL